jgi:hypothetical protein
MVAVGRTTNTWFSIAGPAGRFLSCPAARLAGRVQDNLGTAHDDTAGDLGTGSRSDGAQVANLVLAREHALLP